MSSAKVYNINDSVDHLASFIRENVDVVDRFDIGYGLCGFALFYQQRYQHYGHQRDLRAFYEMTERAIYLANHPIENGFTYIDFTEFGYFLRGHITLLQQQFDVEEMVQQIDTLLLDYAGYAIGQHRLDPYTGGMLQAHYFLAQRIHTGFIKGLVNDFYTEKLPLASAEISQTGITHGLAFFLLFFVRCYEQGICPEKSLHLIGHLRDALLKERQDVGLYGSFFCDNLHQKGMSGLNLCYGDAGIVYALLRADSCLPSGLTTEKPGWMMEQLVHRMEQVPPSGADNILYGRTGHAFYLECLRKSGFIPGKLPLAAFPETDIAWNINEKLTMYGLQEKRKISLLEGATGVAYLHCCRQSGVYSPYVNVLTYLL